MTPRSMLKLKARHPGGGRPFTDGKVGDDLRRKTGDGCYAGCLETSHRVGLCGFQTHAKFGGAAL